MAHLLIRCGDDDGDDDGDDYDDHDDDHHDNHQGLSNPLFPGMENFPRPPGDIQQALTMYQVDI